MGASGFVERKAMNLYRVAHVYRATPGAAPQERVMLVVAGTHEAAANYVNAQPGCEVTGVTTERPNVHLASSVMTESPSPSPEVPKQDKLLTLVRNGRPKLEDIE